MQRSQSLSVVEDEDEAEGENSHHVDAQRQQEKEEVAVVPPSNAVVHPGTVVVEVLRRDGVTLLKSMEAGHCFDSQTFSLFEIKPRRTQPV